VNEFDGLAFAPSGPASPRGGGRSSDQRTGEDVLARLSFAAADGCSVGSAARAQVNVMSFCYLLTLHLLEKTAPKFARIEEI
jgi:hypothetical protein